MCCRAFSERASEKKKRELWHDTDLVTAAANFCQETHLPNWSVIVSDHIFVHIWCIEWVVVVGAKPVEYWKEKKVQHPLIQQNTWQWPSNLPPFQQTDILVPDQPVTSVGVNPKWLHWCQGGVYTYVKPPTNTGKVKARSMKVPKLKLHLSTSSMSWKVNHPHQPESLDVTHCMWNSSDTWALTGEEELPLRQRVLTCCLSQVVCQHMPVWKSPHSHSLALEVTTETLHRNKFTP